MGNFARQLRSYFLLLSLSVSPVFGVELEPKTIRDFTPGLVTDQDSTLIPDGAAQDLQNVDVKHGSIEKRRGSTTQNAAPLTGDLPVKGVFEFVDGQNVYVITVSSNSIFRSSDGGASSTIVSSTHGFTTSSIPRAVSAFSYLWVVDGTTNAVRINATQIFPSTTVPKGTTIAFWAGRLWIGGVSASSSTLYASAVGDGTDWTQDSGLDSDAFSASIRLNDGYPIRSIVPFGRDLLVFKDRSIDRLSVLSDGLTFQLQTVTGVLGTIHADSVGVADNAIIWLGHDGYYRYNNSTITRISDKIKPTVDQIAQLSAGISSYSDTNFTAGTHVFTSSSIVPGSVVLSSFTATDTSTSDFSLGMLSTMTVRVATTASGTVELALANLPFDNGGAETGSMGAWTGEVFIGTCPIGVRTTNPRTGSYSFFVGASTNSAHPTNKAYVQTYCTDTSNSISQVSTGTPPFLSGYGALSVVSPHPGNVCQIVMWAENIPLDISSNAGRILSPFFIFGSTPPVVYADLRPEGVYFDDAVGMSYSSGTFTSRVFDSAVSTAIALSTYSYTASRTTMSVRYQTSGSSLTWGSTQALTSGGNFTANRYFRYLVDFNYVYCSTCYTTSFFSDLTLTARSRSGRYLSAPITLSGNQWSPFTAVSTLNSGAIVYEVYTDTNTSIDPTNAASFTSSQTITSGGTPSLALPSDFVFMASTFTIALATANPTVSEMTIGVGGSGQDTPVSSIFFDQDYYSAVSINGTGQNNVVLIYDENGSWTKYTGLPIGRFGRYRGNLYFGANDAGDIVRMQVPNTARDYNNSAIESYWVSKDFDLGYPLTDKTLLRYYLTAERDAGANLTFSYGVERGSLAAITYPLDTYSGYFRQVVKPSSLTYSEGIQHRFKFYDNTIDTPFSVLSITGKWNLLTNP